MPYAISGYAGGTLRQVVLQDDGSCTGDGLVTGWLAENPPPATDVETVTLHIGKLLTEAHATPLPPPAAAAAPGAPDAPVTEAAPPAADETPTTRSRR